MNSTTQDPVAGRFVSIRPQFEAEFEAYYSAPPLDISGFEKELHEASQSLSTESVFHRKILGYRLMAERCPVHVFQYCPFFFEFNTGRSRTDLGTGGLGGWLKREPFGLQLWESSEQWLRFCGASGLSIGWPVLDDNHHTVGYEKILRVGLRGLIREAEAQVPLAASDSEREFLAAAIEGNRALIRVAERLGAEAERQLTHAADPDIRARLERIVQTASRVPAEPATSFYEALNTILFIFYTLPSIEGNGISVLGHVDRILFPYYERDRAAGRLSEAEARDLIGCFLAISDTRFGLKHAHPWHVGTNGTITLGGCDREGTPLANELTRLFLEAHQGLRLIDPKINARISSRHSADYFEQLARYTVGGGNSLAIFNDDVVIPANVRMGKAPEDARLYVGGGCQENVLEECEVNSRATIYINLLQVFLMGFFPEKWAPFYSQTGMVPEEYGEGESFEHFQSVFLRNLKAVVDAHIDERNRTEQHGVRFNPCPLHSSSMADCLARRRDLMEAGCRYNFGSVSLTGAGTLMDSLFAVKTAVYDRNMVSLASLRSMLESNFEGEEVFRNVLVNRIPKFGQDDPGMRAFSARVLADIARVSSGKPNSRGGRYEASLFSFTTFMGFGAKTGATPDGRRAGTPLSAGMSPSHLALSSGASIGQVLAALEPLDMSLYPVVAVLDVKLPAVRGQLPAGVIVPVLRRFIEAGGSVLQINCVDPQMLKEARAHPEQHPDLVVRVSGYSSIFVQLGGPIQDEIIGRTVVQT